MVERRELITICRQIGTMMEVGVDFLRLTRSLREQTENPRLLELYDQIEHDMRMGETMADAIAKAPDIFSPFAVSLIRQGEARGDIEGAWHRLADFLKQEAQQDKDLGFEAAPEIQSAGIRPVLAASSSALRAAPTDWKREVRRVFLVGATFLGTLALLWGLASLGTLESRWIVPLQLVLAAVFLRLAAGGSGAAAPKIVKPVANSCAFCGRPEGESEGECGALARSSLVPKAAICASCAAAFGQSEVLSEAAKKQSAAQIEMARDFATDFPERFSNRARAGETNGVAPEFTIEDDEGSDTPHQEKRFQL